jgi:endonuclease/exonuclease/phosphatase (EEP) superfamily protein YafD
MLTENPMFFLNLVMLLIFGFCVFHVDYCLSTAVVFIVCMRLLSSLFVCGCCLHCLSTAVVFIVCMRLLSSLFVCGCCLHCLYTCLTFYIGLRFLSCLRIFCLSTTLWAKCFKVPSLWHHWIILGPLHTWNLNLTQMDNWAPKFMTHGMFSVFSIVTF